MARSAGRRAAPGRHARDLPARLGAGSCTRLRTVVLTEAVATVLGTGTLIWGDDAGALRHPYYVDHERLTTAEAEDRDRLASLRRCAAAICSASDSDTSWYELDDENAALTVAAAVPAKPEPVGGALFTRVVRDPGTIVVSLIDLSGSRDGSWSEGTAAGSCGTRDGRGARGTARALACTCRRARS